MVNRIVRVSVMQAMAAVLVLFLIPCAFLAQAAPKAEEPEPAVRILFPSEGDSVSCMEDWEIAIAYTRPDFNAVRLDFFLDGYFWSGATRVREENPNMFTAVMSLSSLSSGAHILKASAIGNRREQVWSAPVHFLVNRYPVITILSPKEGADVWRSIHVKADVSDDFGLRSVTINRQAFEKPPYEADVVLPLEYSNPPAILFEPKPDSTRAKPCPEQYVMAEDTLGLRITACPGVHIKRLFYPDSSPPTFDWWSFFHHRYPETRYQNTDETKPAITPAIYSTEWSVVFSNDPIFQTIVFSSPPSLDGQLVAQWRPSPQEWLGILMLGKDRPNDDVPVYFRIIDGQGVVLWQDYFVISRAEPMSASGLVTDQKGNKFPCGKRTDHNASYVLEVSDNPDFEGELVYSNNYGNRSSGPESFYYCQQEFPLSMSWEKGCELQERYEKLYVRFRARDALGRETVTPICLWPRIEDCYRYR